MTVRKIMIFPKDKAILRAKSEPVRSMDQRTKRLIADLKDTLLASQDGVGLAAPQINAHLRVVVVRFGAQNDWDHEAGPPVALVNPAIIEAGEERKDFDGCLSFPGLYGETIRPHFLHVTSLDEDGNPLDEIYQGFDAVVVHHEIDHLDGVLFIDRVKTLRDLYRVEKDAGGKIRSLPITQMEGIWNRMTGSPHLFGKIRVEAIIREMKNERR